MVNSFQFTRSARLSLVYQSHKGRKEKQDKNGLSRGSHLRVGAVTCRGGAEERRGEGQPGCFGVSLIQRGQGRTARLKTGISQSHKGRKERLGKRVGGELVVGRVVGVVDLRQMSR